MRDGSRMSCIVLCSRGNAVLFRDIYGRLWSRLFSSVLPLLIPLFFGDKRFSVVFGMINAAGYAGGIIAPVLAFVIASRLGGFQFSFLALCILNVVGVVLAAWIRIHESAVHTG